MSNKLQVRLLFFIFAIVLCFFNSACTMTEQPWPYGSEVNQSELISESAQSDLATEASQPESDRRTPNAGLEVWEQPISVHDSLPDFILQLCGEEDVYTELSIVDTSTGTIMYEDHFDFDMYCISKELFTVEMIDMDFDGYRDIDIYTGFTGNWKKFHVYIMWAPDMASFVGDIYGLAGLGAPKFDADNKLVTSGNRASAADHWLYKHKYVEGKLITIEEISNNCVWDNWLDDSSKEQIKSLEPLYVEDSTFMHYTKKQLDESTMELVIVEEKYVLFTETVEVAEYPSGSEMGLLLASYEKYRD